jgi:putative transposase
MRRSYKYRLYPNANQTRELAIMVETHRRLYNAALDDRKTAHEAEKRTVKYTEQSARYKAERVTNPYYARTNFSSAQATLRRLDNAYAAFFDRIGQGGGPAGYPRFKGRDRFDSVCFPTHGDGNRLTGNRLRLQHVGVVKVKLHRDYEGNVKTVTVKRRAGKWYVVLSCDLGDVPVPPKDGLAVGIDVGLEHFLTTSEGKHVANPRFLKGALPALRRAQRALSRKTKGGSNRRKQRLVVARLHAKVSDTRRDFHWKAAGELVRRAGLVGAEGLSILGMIKNRRLARSIADAAWGGFLQALRSKAESAGCAYVEVNCRGTSQECSGCGAVVVKGLSVRTHDCPGCGLVLQRDHNAALNILARGLARMGPAGCKQSNGLVCPRSLPL